MLDELQRHPNIEIYEPTILLIDTFFNENPEFEFYDESVTQSTQDNSTA